MSTLYLQILERIDKLADRVQLYRDDMVQQNAQVTSKMAILQAELNRLAADVKGLMVDVREKDGNSYELRLAYERLYTRVKMLNTDTAVGHKAVVINNHTNTQVGDAAVNQQTGTHNDTNADLASE